MEMRIRFPGGTKVDAAFLGHVVHTDQPPASGGEGSAPSPFDLFVASIGTCAGYYVLAFCRKREIPTDGIELVLTRDEACARFELPGDRIGILTFSSEAFLYCPLTADYDAASMFLSSIDESITSGAGTALAAALIAHGAWGAGAGERAGRRAARHAGRGPPRRGGRSRGRHRRPARSRRPGRVHRHHAGRPGLRGWYRAPAFFLPR